jgi:hypothetical protein
VHFVFRDPCHLLHVPERAFNVTGACRSTRRRGVKPTLYLRSSENILTSARVVKL